MENIFSVLDHLISFSCWVVAVVPGEPGDADRFSATEGTSQIPFCSTGGQSHPKPSPEYASDGFDFSFGGKFSWMSGLGGNIAVLGGDDGVLAIDSGLPNLVETTATEIAKSGKITQLVNTHWHYDHVGGNEALAKAGAHITAHANCRKRVSTDQYNEPLTGKCPRRRPLLGRAPHS